MARIISVRMPLFPLWIVYKASPNVLMVTIAKYVIVTSNKELWIQGLLQSGGALSSNLNDRPGPAISADTVPSQPIACMRKQIFSTS
jgi:hypothetical protein